MPYKRSYRRKSSKGSFKRAVKKVVTSLAESRTSYLTDDFTLPLQTLSNQVLVKRQQVLNLISTDSKATRTRDGYEIYLTGLRCAMSYDNSVDTAGIPLYITTMVIMTNDTDPAYLGKLFRGYDKQNEFASGPPATGDAKEWREDVHTRAINGKAYKLLHRSSIRLGCKVQPDLPGPRYAQRVIYIPVNRKITFPKETQTVADNEQIKPLIFIIHLVSNPTYVQQTGTAESRIRTEVVSYYKDL